MAISESALNQIIGRNAAQFAATSKSNTYSKPVNENYDYYGINDDYSSNDSDVDDYYGIPMQTERKQEALPSTFTKEQAMRSNLPDFIKQSMVDNEIEVHQPSLDSNPLQESAIAKFAEQSRHLMNITNHVNESSSYQPQRRAVNNQMSPSIDYALIKTIVKECIAEEMKNLSSNDNALKQINLSGGKIRLIDNSGNIYSAKLEKTGNVNDNKKKQ